jgi:TonB-linked SusC/RagA family outer membrane protein
MKKILPFLLLPCIAIGANSHPGANDLRNSNTTVTARHVSDNKLISATRHEADFELKGFVRDASGQPLIGVSVSIKGTKKGTQTDANGKFSLTVNTGDVLVFTYIGYIKKEVTLTVAAELTVQMDEDSQQLSEIVVTALGIKKERKALGYSVTEVKGDELTTGKEVNFADELVGKVAGVNVSSISGGPASAVNINIRGAASLSGANQPLYVINGVPMNNIDNTEIVGLSMNSGGQYSNSPDQGDGIGNINPDDIETISVLKGAAAAALYGSRAKYGVILITTKSGSSKGTVEFSSNYEAQSAINPTDYQYTYGNGAQGLAPTTALAAFNSGNSSWGAKLDGSSVVQFDGVSRPYVAQKNNFDDFYRTGGTFTNTVSFGKSYDLAAIRFSASDLHNTSITPNSGYDRRSFNFAGNFSPIKRLTIDAHINYVNDDAQNRPILGDGPGNSSYQVLFLPTSLNIKTLSPATGGTNAAGNELQFTNNNYATNPWFAADKFINNSSRNRIIASASARYTFDNGLFAQVRIGQDYYTERYTNVVPTGTAYYAQAFQNLGETYDNVSELNTDFLIGKAFKLHDLTITPNVGGNLEKSKVESTTESGVGFVIPDVYTIGNTATKSIAYGDYLSDINSLYGTLSLGYKSFLYLDGTARSDWFSTIASSASPNNKLNIVYPSISGSFVFSELWKPSWLDFGKLRFGLASVGAATTPYQTLLNYGLLPSQLHGMPLGTITNSSTPNSDLRPSDATELEIGTELHTLNNRLSFDVTWYNKLSKNEIVPAPASITSGYQGAVLNIGQIRNRGVEILITGVPVKLKNFTWTTSLNAAYNDNTVLALAAGQSSLPVATSRTGVGFTEDVVGKAADQVEAFDYKYDASGKIVVDPTTGIPVQGALKTYGSAYGKWSGGLNNNFAFGRLNLSFLIDTKLGGKVFAGDEYYAYQNGLSAATLPGRTTGFGPNGVTSAENYYTTLGNNVSSLFVQDASFIKFRQLTFGYNFPASMFNNAIQGINISLVGRNLFYLMKKTTDIDPEASYGTLSQGLQLGGLPATRTYGLSLNVKF